MAPVKPNVLEVTEEEESEQGPGLNVALFTSLLEDLNQKSAAGDFAYLQDGRNQLRLTHDTRDGKEVFAEMTRMWNGTPRKKYIIRALVLNGKDTDAAPQVKFVVIPKAVLTQIISLAAEGYNLFGKVAHGVNISKSGTGLETSYTVIPSRKTIDFPLDVPGLDMTLREAAALFERQDAERDKNRQVKAAEGTPSGRKKNQSVELDDED